MPLFLKSQTASNHLPPRPGPEVNKTNSPGCAQAPAENAHHVHLLSES